MIGQPRDAIWENMLAKMNQAEADLKARLERLERTIGSYALAVKAE